MNTQNNHPVGEQLTEQSERNEQTLGTEPAKKTFVEPAVSVPVDVLEEMGEDEVRRRLDAKPGDVEEPGLVREWLTQRDRVAAPARTATLGSRFGCRACSPWECIPVGQAPPNPSAVRS